MPPSDSSARRGRTPRVGTRTARIWRRICPHFCYACDRPTLLEHRHKVLPFEELLRDEARRP